MSPGGEGGIRTLVTPERQTVFETAAFNRSATSPGGRDGIRTRDLLLAKQAFSRLNYSPMMVSSGGFEPPTPSLGNLCSILLSYEDDMVERWDTDTRCGLAIPIIPSLREGAPPRASDARGSGTTSSCLRPLSCRFAG